MTRDAFHRLITDDKTGARLDAMLADNARVDAEIEAQRQQQQNDTTYLAAIRAWFRKTDPPSGVA